MKVVEIADPVTLAALVKPDPTRSAGLHLSTVIGDLMRQLDPKRFGGTIRPEYIGLGIAFEDLLAAHLRASVLGWEKPGEFASDGILMSPDAIDPAFGPEECKLTWVKGKPGALALQDPKLLRYHLQAKSYCRVLGTDRMRFRILFVNGGYEKTDDYDTFMPALRTFVVTYSRQEIRDTWEQLLQHAEDAGLRKR